MFISYQNRARHGKQSGFALVIALLLMAFVLLLLLTMTTFVTVETSRSQIAQERLSAELNALLAMNIAIGELQKYAGPDRRTTASADLSARNADGDRIGAANAPANDLNLSGSNNGLTALSEGTRYWTGVWQDANAPADIYTTNPSPRLLNWLVSGNQDNANDFTPNLGIRVDANTLEYPLSNGESAVLLVGAGSAGTENIAPTYLENYGINSPDASDVETAADRYVVAPIVDLPEGNGGFAFWVGDEGVKARYNVIDAYADSLSASDDRLRYRTAPRIAPEIAIAADLPQPNTPSGNTKTNFSNTPNFDYDSYPFPGNRAASDVAALAKVHTPDQANLVHFPNPANVDERLKKRFHALSTKSKGLLTNSLSGGLRQDLSLALKNSSAFSAMFADDFILPSTVSPASGPRWSTIQAYHNLASRSTDSINLDNAANAGIRPSIAEFRLVAKLYPNRVTNTWEVRVGIALGIANPYAVPLTTSGLIVRLDRLGRDPATGDSIRIGSASDPSRGAWWLIANNDITSWNGTGSAQVNQWRSQVIASFKLTDAPTGSNNANDGILTRANTFFTTPSTTWQPGEFKMFAITNRTQLLDNGAVSLTETDVGPLDSYYASFNTGVALPTGDTPTTEYDAWINPITHNDGFGATLPTGIAIELYNPASSTPLVRIEPLAAYSAAPIIPQINNNVDLQGGIMGGCLQINLTLPYSENLTFLTNVTHQTDFRRPYPARPFIDNNVRARGYFPGPFLAQVGTTNKIEADLHYSGKRTSVANSYTEGSFGTPWDWGGSFTGAGTSAHSRLSLYDAPRIQNSLEPLFTSIAQLQHVDLTADDRALSVGHQSGLAVGNSFFSPLISRQLSQQVRSADIYSSPIPTKFFDISYLLNAELFDGFFFSTYTGGGAPSDLPNRLYQVENPGDFLSASSSEIPGTGPAKSIRVEGAFNVNSTSMDAWSSVLASTIRVPVNGDNQSKGTAFARSLSPEGSTEQANHGDAADSYNGYRRLTDQEIREFATEVVRQVRQRGPFTSLAHFVNRALVPASGSPLAPPASLGLNGALQAAINNADINRLPGLNGDDQVQPKYLTVPSDDGLADTNWWPDAGFDYSTILAASSSNDRSPWGNHLTGIPGILTQADVLQVLAPILTARSDTFTIRTYGETKDMAGTTSARVWAEAVVQREAEYVDSANLPGADPDALSAINQNFGRAFRIVSFRWITEDEI